MFIAFYVKSDINKGRELLNCNSKKKKSMSGKVQCAICGHEMWPSEAYYCSNCEIWICRGCAGVAGLGALFSDARCPRCGRKLKRK